MIHSYKIVNLYYIANAFKWSSREIISAYNIIMQSDFPFNKNTEVNYIHILATIELTSVARQRNCCLC